jgi:hypothetical protein
MIPDSSEGAGLPRGKQILIAKGVERNFIATNHLGELLDLIAVG